MAASSAASSKPVIVPTSCGLVSGTMPDVWYLVSVSAVITSPRTPRSTPPSGTSGYCPGNSRIECACIPRESLPQPESTATYCLPSTMNVVGGATMPVLVGYSQSSLPVDGVERVNLAIVGAAGEDEPAGCRQHRSPVRCELGRCDVHTRWPVSTFHACTSPPTWSAPGAEIGGPPNCVPAKLLPA